jgi:hypothetical protein
MAINYWTHDEIRIIVDALTPEMGSEDLKGLTKKIYRSEMAINSKILEIIGIKDQTKVVKDVIEENYKADSSFEGDFHQLINGEFPNLDLNYIPSHIFASVLTNRKLKLALGDKVLFRPLEDIFRMTCYSDNMKRFIENTSNVYSIGGIYGKSFWLSDDMHEYPIQFHVDLIRKLIKLN